MQYPRKMIAGTLGRAAVISGLMCMAASLPPNGADGADGGLGARIVIEGPQGGAHIKIDARNLPVVGTRWLYRFPVVVTAREPILGVKVNGQSQNLPYASSVSFQKGVWLSPGENRVLVEAFTLSEETSRSFQLNLVAPTKEPEIRWIDLDEQEILIFRPLDNDPEVVEPDTLLQVPGGEQFYLEPGVQLYLEPGRQAPSPGGLMYGFEVEVSAFSSISSVAVNGNIVHRPGTTFARVLAPVILAPGANSIRVDVTTGTQTVSRDFHIRLNAVKLPGTRLFIPAPSAAASQDAPRQ